ncbi:MAG: hypothetical protein PHI02_07080 [Sulfurovaceae bacterium]|nr:hypothetical protein [Sulfurovaceae bacterium]
MEEKEETIEANKKSGTSVGSIIFWIVIIGVLVLFAFISIGQRNDLELSRTYSTTQESGDNIYDNVIDSGQPIVEAAKKQVIDDAIKQYQIVEKSGNIVDMCVQAGIVKAAYLQANDESGYKSWSNITTKACEAAGMPGM